MITAKMFLNVLLSARNKIIRPSLSHVAGFGMDRFASTQLLFVVISQVERPSVSASAFYISTAIVLLTIIVLILIGIRQGSLVSIVLKTATVISASAALSTGVLFQLEVFAVSTPAFFSLLTLVSIGSALLLVNWGILFCAGGVKMTLVEAASGFFLSIVLSFISTLLTPSLQAVLFIVATFGNGLLLNYSKQLTDEKPSDTYQPKIHTPQIIKPYLALFCFGSAIAISAVIFSFPSHGLNASGNILRMISAFMIMVLIILLMLFSKREAAIPLIYRSSFLIIMCGGLLAFLFPPNSLVLSAVLFTMTSMMMIVSISVFLNFTSINPARAFRIVSLGLATIAAGNLTGRFVMRMITDSIKTTEVLFVGGVVGILMMFLLIYTVLYTERNIQSWKTSLEDTELAQTSPTIRETSGLCATIGSEYSLTFREIEILHLLAKGRSSRRIQEELFISESTANTHTRHIYNKLNVHTRQELLDFVEQFPKLPIQ